MSVATGIATGVACTRRRGMLYYVIVCARTRGVVRARISNFESDFVGGTTVVLRGVARDQCFRLVERDFDGLIV